VRIGDLGAPELILIVVALVLVFGAGKLGDIGGALGKSVREFKKASNGGDGGPPNGHATAAAPVVTDVAPATLQQMVDAAGPQQGQKPEYLPSGDAPALPVESR